jgi:hypothetical protein
MGNPQQPEIARSRKVPSQDQDAVAGVIEGQESLGADAPRGPVPPENRPGHHPEQEQDKPDLDAFAQRLGIGDSPAEEAELEPAVTREPAAAIAGVARSGAGRIAALVAVVLAVLGIVLTKQRRRKRS